MPAKKRKWAVVRFDELNFADNLDEAIKSAKGEADYYDDGDKWAVVHIVGLAEPVSGATYKAAPDGI